jgi:O-antigen/teichoic acid export membrane protein
MTPAATAEATPIGSLEAAASARRLLVNAASLLLAYLLPRLFLAASVIVAARVLGAQTFGIYGTAAAYAVVVSILATLGMQPLLVREMARAPERAPALLRAADLVKGVAGAVMLATLIALAAPLGYGREVVSAAVLLGISNWVFAFIENRAALVQAQERMHVWTEASALYGLVAGGGGIVLVIVTRDVLWFCASAAIGQLASFLWLRTRAPVTRPGRLESGAVLTLVRSVAPFAAAFIALALHAKIAVLLLAHWRPEADVGAFVAGYKFVDIAQALVVVVAGAAYPRLSRSFPQRAGPWMAGARLADLLLLGSAPFAAALWLAREPVIALLFGNDYAASVPVVGFLAASLPALAVNVGGAFVLSAAGRISTAALLYAGAVLLDVVLCALWVPQLGAAGAANALLVSEWLLAVGMMLALHVAAHVRLRPTAALGFLGIVILTPAVHLLPDISGGWIRAGAVIACAGALYRAIGVLSKEERALLRDAMRRRPAGLAS